jgi:DNA-binding transcriptional LysR family regulator
MNYERLDLNLLKVFDAVMTELNVTRAADRLCMTQPAVSNALNRLRRLLNDELFLKIPTGVKPTPKAIELWLPIRDALTQIHQAIEPITFDPATAETTFTLAMNDFSSNLILPLLLAVCEQVAPKVDLRIVPMTHINAPTLLEQAEIDLAVGVCKINHLKLRLRSHPLVASSFVCVMRREHPFANQKLTLERYIKAKHLLVSLTGESTGLIEPILEKYALKRRIALTVNQFAVAPQLIANSDLIGVLPKRIVEISRLSEQLYLTPLPAEIDIAPSEIQMIWHERNHQNSAQVWLRSCLTKICINLE